MANPMGGGQMGMNPGMPMGPMPGMYGTGGYGGMPQQPGMYGMPPNYGMYNTGYGVQPMGGM